MRRRDLGTTEDPAIIVTDQYAGLVNELVRARWDQDLTQGHISVRIGVTRQAVTQWENHYTEPSLQHLARWASVLGKELKIQLIDSAP